MSSAPGRARASTDPIGAEHQRPRYKGYRHVDVRRVGRIALAMHQVVAQLPDTTEDIHLTFVVGVLGGIGVVGDLDEEAVASRSGDPKRRHQRIDEIERQGAELDLGSAATVEVAAKGDGNEAPADRGMARSQGHGTVDQGLLSVEQLTIGDRRHRTAQRAHPHLESYTLAVREHDLDGMSVADLDDLKLPRGSDELADDVAWCRRQRSVHGVAASLAPLRGPPDG